MTGTLTHIRLELARETGRPTGDPGDGWDIVAVLDADSRLDAEGCRAAGDKVRVRRFSGDRTVAVGRLRQGPGGRWILDLDPDEAVDAAGFRFEDERFVTGEYVSLNEADGDQHTYVVARSTPL